MLTRAYRLHRAGQVAEAEDDLPSRPRSGPTANAVVLHLLGVLAIQGRAGPQGAVELIERAIVIDPHSANYRCSLGVAHQTLGRLDDALTCFGQALAIVPDDVDALTNSRGRAPGARAT